MSLHMIATVASLSLLGFGCATKEVEPNKKVETEQMIGEVPKTESAPNTESLETKKSLESSDQLVSAPPPTDTIHPYKRTDGPKTIEVQIVKPDGQPTVTDSADPNLLSGGGANMGVTLMTKKEAAKTAGKVEAATEFSDSDLPVANAGAAKVATGVPAEKALGWLKNGNIRFVRGTVRRDGQSAKDRKRVLQKQSPHAFILACSESVAPPELVFDQKLGEISVARNLGASVDDSAIRAMEDSVQRGAQLVVILDHSGCTSKLDHHDAANEIAAKSKMLDALVKSGAVTIKTAIYDQDNGRVSF